MTTPHADRDRSERPWWPPSAPGGYLIHTTPAPFVGEPFVAERDVDEPVPFVLSDEPQGELLPVAPEGIEISCSMCPATLADTGGGVLWHMEDGSHTFEPSGAPATIPLRGKPDRDAERTVHDDEHGPRHPVNCERCYWRGRAEAAEAECTERLRESGRWQQRAMVAEARSRDLEARAAQTVGALRSEAQGLLVGTFLRPANAPTAAVLENVADLLAAEVGP